MADEAEVALLRQLLEFAQRDAGYADEYYANTERVDPNEGETK